MKPTKSTRPKVEKRNLYEELMEGLVAIKEFREGKRTLKVHKVQFRPPKTIKPAELKRARKQLNLSAPQFARYLRTNPRTLENWEQGRAKPNAQAALLIRLVMKFPDTVARIAQV